MELVVHASVTSGLKCTLVMFLPKSVSNHQAVHTTTTKLFVRSNRRLSHSVKIKLKTTSEAAQWRWQWLKTCLYPQGL